MNLKHICCLLSICLLWELPVSGQEPLRQANGPYEIEGKRIVFTNWFYVRAGDFKWLDKDGNNVKTDRDVIMDAQSARFVQVSALGRVQFRPYAYMEMLL